MKNKFERPMRFGEILDVTFQISKGHFSKLFLLLLIFMGPIILLQALSEIIAGYDLIRDVDNSQWFEQSLNTYEDASLLMAVAESIGIILTTLLMTLFYPVLFAAIILLVKRVKDGEAYTVSELIKKAFTRFWPLLWSTLLISVIVSAILIIPTIIILTILFSSIATNALAGIITAFLLFLGGFIGFGLLFTRWSFYLPAVLFDRVAPGLTASWKLSKGRVWKLFWLYVVFILITFAFITVVELFSFFLGMSVLYGVILNIVILFTTLFTVVGYGVMYFDSVTRNTADDLKGMIHTYHEEKLQ
ncbi:hypothetical protein [Paraliobacillus sp. JSM ZJ581]|uniref:hypothetical protein n=1 Tax=Paraliobacillus sp. JSM ZJ581 TaxID=3342118 RepID=UPI0035A9A9BF